MISLDIKDVGEEIRTAREFRDKHTRMSRELAKRFAGKWYREDLTCPPTPENHIFAYIAFMLAELSYSSPSADVKPAWTQALAQVAKAMEVAIDRWGTTFPLAVEQQLIARDTLLGWGVMKVGLESVSAQAVSPNVRMGQFGMEIMDSGLGVSSGGEWWSEDESVIPFSVHVPMWDFFMDARCEHWKHSRFHAHEYWRDLNELSGVRGADQSLVSRLTSEYDSSARDERNRPMPQAATGERKQVRCIDMWFPEHKMVCTVVESGSGYSYLRNPSEWWGPKDGPFEVFGFYSVAGDPYPCGPLTPIFDQILELQAHITESADEASRQKTVILVDSSASDVANAIEKGVNNGVHVVKNLGNNLQVVKVGGTDNIRMEHISSLRERVDRILGMSDAQRGVGQNRMTATVGQIVQNNVDMRTSWMRMCITVGMSLVLKKVGWYMFHDPLYKSKVSIGGKDGTFHGGIWPGQESMDWERDFNVHVKPNSMSMSDDQVLQSRAMQLLALAPQVAQGISTMPQVNWRALVDMLGESYNEKNLYDRVFGNVEQQGINTNAINPQLAEQMKGTAQEMGLNVMGPQFPDAGKDQMPGNGMAPPADPSGGMMTEVGTMVSPESMQGGMAGGM